jgi:hypothetical protein
MNPFVIAATVIVVLLVLLWLWVRGRRVDGDNADAADRLDTLAAWPPRSTRILTSQERLAFATLLKAFPDHVVMAQVPLSRFIRVPTRYSHAEWLRRVGQLCADLVVCDTATQPLAVVIVEAPGGANSERAKARRSRMMRVLKAADVRCQVWVENAMPTVEVARASLLDAAPAGGGAAGPAQIAAQGAAKAPASTAFDDTERSLTRTPELDESEPPPTWYDDLGSGPVPLQPNKRDEPRK